MAGSPTPVDPALVPSQSSLEGVQIPSGFVIPPGTMMNPEELMSILRQIKPADAAQALSTLSQSQFPTSSHPQYHPQIPMYQPIPIAAAGPSSQTDEAQDGTQEEADGSGERSTSSPPGTRAKAKAAAATMGSEEWSRQRKDNHKEVERRRRGNINEGINELGRIVPNGSGEKAKGAILSRAVQYIHHLKENEARNIEKWTLEKLLMDQAMGDLQAQLEEMRRLWDEERAARTRADAEARSLRQQLAEAQRGVSDDEDDEDMVLINSTKRLLSEEVDAERAKRQRLG